MLFELFILGTFWFWALMILWGIALLIYLDRDSLGGALTVTIATTVLLIVGGAGNPLPYVFDNPVNVLMYVGGFFGVGAIWSVIKWQSFCAVARRRYIAFRDEWLESKDEQAGPVPDTLKQEWTDHVDDYTQRSWQGDAGHLQELRSGGLKASKRKATITTWIMWWPVSVVWTIINDPIRRLVNWMYRQLQAVYNKISAFNARGVSDDFE